MVTEAERYIEDTTSLLQKTAREQDILDGGTGETIYVFTERDANNLIDAGGWSGDESAPDLNVGKLFNPR